MFFVGEEMTVHIVGISLLLTDKVVGSFKSPALIEYERLDQWLNVPFHVQCGEKRLPTVQPSIRLWIEPRTSFQELWILALPF